MKDHSDHELLNLWRNDDQEAYGVLVVRYYAAVICACRRQAPPGEDEDCAQAVFLILARKKPTPAECPVLVAWLLQVTTHVCLHARRSAARRRRLESETAAVASPQPAESPEALAHLDECLLRLPERQRTAITLHFLVGKTPAEVATVMKTTQNNAHQLLSRGLAQLRLHLSRRGIVVAGTSLTALLATIGQASAIEAPLPALASLVNNPSPTVAALADGAHKMMPTQYAEPMRIGFGLLLITALVAWSGLADVVRGKSLVQDEAQRLLVLPTSAASVAMDAIDQRITWTLEFEHGIKALAKVRLEWNPPGEHVGHEISGWSGVAAGFSEQRITDAWKAGNYYLRFEAPGFASQWRNFEITGAGAMVPQDFDSHVTLLRNRYAVLSYVFNPTGSRTLTGEGCLTGRVAVGHWGKLPGFGEDWQVWQGSKEGKNFFGSGLTFEFFRFAKGFGCALAPSGSAFDDAREAPENSAYNCAIVVVEPGQLLYFRVNGNTGNGIGYGKVHVDEITETPDASLEILQGSAVAPTGIN